MPPGYIPLCDETTLTNCAFIQVTPTGRSEFSVRIENKNGCAASDRTFINVKKDSPIYIPTAFSPINEDGINDLFLIYADNTRVVTHIKAFLIFDRWGEAVFENYNFQPAPLNTTHGWDGTFAGQPMNSGVYIYYAEIEFEDGHSELYKGDITIR